MVRIKLEESNESIEIMPEKRSSQKKKSKIRKLDKGSEKLDSSGDFELSDFDEIATEIELTEELTEVEEFATERRLKWKYLSLALIVLLVSFITSNITISRCGFWATYFNNYNKIVHGDERYCFRPLDASMIIDKLQDEVIGQDDALKLVTASLHLANREKIIQMAFTGPIGVGKSLTANLIIDNFKWNENVVSLIYDLSFKHPKNQEDEDDFTVVTSKLSDCGFNLVVIDDVNTDESTVKRIAKLERHLHRLAKQNIFKIVLIVIFNGDLQQEVLTNFVLVEYLPFTKETFRQCIEAHEKRHNVKLSPKDFEELTFINFTALGCKTLAKKLNLVRE